MELYYIPDVAYHHNAFIGLIVGALVGGFTKAALAKTAVVSAFTASVIAGAAGGAAASLATGNNVLKGAVTGGVTGGALHGVGSLLSKPATAAPTAPGTAPVTAAPGSLSLAGGNVQTLSTTPVPTGTLSGTSAGLATTSGLTPGANTFQIQPSTFFGRPPISSSTFSGTSAAPLTLGGSTQSIPTQSVSPGTISPLGQMGIGGSAPNLAPGTDGLGVSNVQGVGRGALPANQPISLQGAQPLNTTIGTSTQPPKPTFAETLKQMPAEIAAKFKDPKTLAEMTLRAGAMLAGSTFAGDGMSPEERALLEAYTEELRQTRQANQALFDQKMQQAQALIGEAQYFDPEYFGLQASRRAQIQASQARRAGLRNLRGSARDVASRQLDIETGRSVGSAFDQGYGTAIQGRLGTIQGGLTAMPSPMNVSSGYGAAFNAFDRSASRRRERQEDIGGLFRTILG